VGVKPAGFVLVTAVTIETCPPTSGGNPVLRFWGKRGGGRAMAAVEESGSRCVPDRRRSDRWGGKRLPRGAASGRARKNDRQGEGNGIAGKKRGIWQNHIIPGA